jgi:hypothetical protein
MLPARFLILINFTPRKVIQGMNGISPLRTRKIKLYHYRLVSRL